MDFTEALELCVGGEKVARKNWGQDVYLVVVLEKVGGFSYFVERKILNGNKLTWKISEEDLIAEDWEIRNTDEEEWICGCGKMHGKRKRIDPKVIEEMAGRLKESYSRYKFGSYGSSLRKNEKKETLNKKKQIKADDRFLEVETLINI